MTLSVDLFSFSRSPFSYLALPKALKLVAEYDAAVNLRPVHPLAVRVPGFFRRADPRFALRGAGHRSRRQARRHPVPRFPRPDPLAHAGQGADPSLAHVDGAPRQPYQTPGDISPSLPTKQSIAALNPKMDRFVEPVIGAGAPRRSVGSQCS